MSLIVTRISVLHAIIFQLTRAAEPQGDEDDEATSGGLGVKVRHGGEEIGRMDRETEHSRFRARQWDCWTSRR